MLKEIEKGCTDTCDTNINMYVPWYLMAAYAYYVEDDPILTDSMFDKMTKRALDNWDEINHVHKTFLTKEMLEAGTYLGEYPPHVEGAVKSVRDTYK